MRRDHVLQFVLEAAQTPDFQGVTAQAVADALSIWRNDAAVELNKLVAEGKLRRVGKKNVRFFPASEETADIRPEPAVQEELPQAEEETGQYRAFSGLVGADGETHHGCFDALYLPQVPGMTVYCPANFAELRRMLRRALYETDGPVAVRYPRGGEGAYYTGCGSDALADCLREGTDCTVLSYGVLVNHALEAARRLEAEGISVRVVKLNRIAPLDGGEIAEVLRGTRRLVVLEDCLARGCVGERVAALLAETGEEPERLVLKNAGESLPPQGTVPQLEHALGLDADGVAESVKEVLHEQ